MFYHFLITRFNLKNPDWDVTKNNEALLDEKWMDERFELFSNYCLPSVINQTNKNFKWLVFFDTSTSKIYQEKIENFVHENFDSEHKSKNPKYQFTWHGLMGYTKNRIRLIGEEPKNKVLLYNLGCNGVGLLLSIYGGKKISQIINKENLPPSIFDPKDN